MTRGDSSGSGKLWLVIGAAILIAALVLVYRQRTALPQPSEAATGSVPTASPAPSAPQTVPAGAAGAEGVKETVEPVKEQPVKAEVPVMAKQPEAAAEPVRDSRIPLLDFGPDFDLSKAKQNQATAELVAGTEPALKIVTSKTGSWPGVSLVAPAGKWDLSKYEYISLDLVNADTHDIDVFVRVDNPGADGRKNCFTQRIGLQADQRVTMNIPLRRENQSKVKLFGMQGYPQGMYQEGGIDPAQIVALVVFTNDKQNDSRFLIRNVRAGGSYTDPAWARMTPEQFFPFIDRYGQFIHKDWPGKTHSDADLQKSREEEAIAAAADQGPAEWDAWGGWAKGPQLEATGHFRTGKHNGKWALIDPDGRLFFSSGICCVGYGGAAGVVEDRANWFAELPSQDDPQWKGYFQKSWKIWSGHYAGREPLMFNFSSANLLRKYGADWKEAYKPVVQNRLRRWGINTIGNWSDGGIARLRKTPYTATFFYDSPKLQGGKYHFSDPFAPEFAPAVEKGFLQWSKDSANDPWCIGYFLDNEIPWGGSYNLAQKSLDSPATQPARKALIEWLQKKYPEISALNSAWGTQFASWDAFGKEAKKLPAADAGRKDLEEFTTVFAQKYYGTIRDIIKKHAPKKLYLGDRSVGGAPNTVAAAAKFCDVLSFNRYCYSVRDVRLPGGVDAPVLIGEFHFCALDRSPFWSGLATADNQADRGRLYREYVNSALDNPQIVGAHWFQYGDEATVGRGDGENAQCGFVDVCDTPYAETVQAARQTGEEMYRRRFGK